MTNRTGEYRVDIHGVPNSRNEDCVTQWRKTEEEARALAIEYSNDGYATDLYIPVPGKILGTKEKYPAKRI